MKTNLLLNTDSYKASMYLQYPPGTTSVFSYIESRGGRYPATVFFGLQAFIKEYLTTPITQEDIDEADEIWTAHGEPFNRAGWEYILKTYDGYLPVTIRAAPEGSVIPTGNVLVTIESKDPECFWLTTFLETALLRAVWYPTTVATNSREIKKVIRRYLEDTGDVSGLPFKLHDFGARGVSSNESAMLGGMAHLVNFMGTDTIAGVVGARRYYNEPIAGFSIPAAEHSTITSWGRDNEVEAYRNMLTQFAKPGALLAVVSDSYDIYNAVENLWGGVLREQVVESGATVVVRPDSGDPVEVVTRVTKLLAEKFGTTVNDKGYRVLNNVRVIQGDGIDIDSVRAILQSLKSNGFSADNIAFGMGGALLQGPQRDDQKFAMKCSAALIDGQWVEVYKDPITDPGKQSKRGRLELIWDCGLGSCGYRTVPEEFASDKSVLRVVYDQGEAFNEVTFSEVRANAEVQETSDVSLYEDTQSAEYTQWVADVWKGNAER
jgi:nicotinamide phosphoribosyltransferase